MSNFEWALLQAACWVLIPITLLVIGLGFALAMEDARRAPRLDWGDHE